MPAPTWLVGKLPWRKQAMFLFIVFAVSAVFSFLLGAAGGRPDGSWNWFPGAALGLSAGGLFLLLSGNRAVAIAGDAARRRALAGPVAGQAQLLVVRQGFVGKLAGVDVAVDGGVVAQLKSPRFAAIALAPGRHAVTAAVQGRLSDAATLDLAAGETAVLRIKLGMGPPALIREPDVAAMRTVLARVPMVVA